jgi:hypothetical protein
LYFVLAVVCAVYPFNIIVYLVTLVIFGEEWTLVAGEGMLREETNVNLSSGRSRFFKDRSATGHRYRTSVSSHYALVILCC